MKLEMKSGFAIVLLVIFVVCVMCVGWVGVVGASELPSTPTPAPTMAMGTPIPYPSPMPTPTMPTVKEFYLPIVLRCEGSWCNFCKLYSDTNWCTDISTRPEGLENPWRYIDG